jgi:hypothetical protein
MTKVCTKCKEEKGFDDFGKCKREKDGLQYWCKACKSHHYQSNKESIRKKQKEYNTVNREARLKRQAEYRRINREVINNKQKEHYYLNREERLSVQKLYRQDNREKIRGADRSRYQSRREKVLDYQKRYYQENKDKVKARCCDYILNRLKTDNIFRMTSNLRSRVRRAIIGFKKTGTTMDLIGCTAEQARAHIEAQFTDGMSWENYGYYGWHIDHIIPCASFDLSDPEQQRQCFHYTNLQPLWAEDNFSKSDKLPEEHQPELPIAI